MVRRHHFSPTAHIHTDLAGLVFLSRYQEDSKEALQYLGTWARPIWICDTTTLPSSWRVQEPWATHTNILSLTAATTSRHPCKMTPPGDYDYAEETDSSGNEAAAPARKLGPNSEPASPSSEESSVYDSNPDSSEADESSDEDDDNSDDDGDDDEYDDDEPREAPTFMIPSRTIAAVEHPFMVVNTDKALETFGVNPQYRSVRCKAHAKLNRSTYTDLSCRSWIPLSLSCLFLSICTQRTPRQGQSCLTTLPLTMSFLKSRFPCEQGASGRGAVTVHGKGRSKKSSPIVVDHPTILGQAESWTRPELCVGSLRTMLAITRPRPLALSSTRTVTEAWSISMNP